MTQALVHRGPDDEGFYRDDVIALGHRRLSIVDLAGGHQPMSNENDTLQLVCNGEIYNSPDLRRDLQSKGHTFKTACDVEVILHLYEEYGKDCVKYLRGMFAFAIWDPGNRTLFMARDHMGQKHLYFHQTEDEFIFASEIRAIVEPGLIDRQIDTEALWHYVSLRFMPEDFTLFKGIRKLPPATSLEWRDGRMTTEKYWTLSFKNKVANDPAQVEEDLDGLIRETIDNHLLSDVRVGAFLSGGIDSGTIASVMATLIDDPVPTFSIGVKEQSYNELPYSRMVNQRYGMEQHEEIVEANIIGRLPAMVYSMEEPADPYGVGVYLVSQLASKTVKVVLGGDGGDENFAGYDRFSGQMLLDY
jgi:asparagine synthase (glutamine-hydrolysing)